MYRRFLLRVAANLTVLVLLAGSAAAQTTAASSAPGAADLLIGKWQYSTDGGASFSDQLGEAPAKATVLARNEFVVENPGRYAALELTHGLDAGKRYSFALNGGSLQGPVELEGLALRTIPGIYPGVLIRGVNVLTAEGRPAGQVGTGQSNPLDIHLAGLESKDLKIVAGPILGARGDDYLTLTCRTNIPCRVTLRINGSFASASQPATQPGPPTSAWYEIRKTSSPGLFHRFRVEGVGGMQMGTYQLTAQTDDGVGVAELGPTTIAATTNASGALRFVAVGDSRTNRADWGLVAAAMLKARPQFVIHTGDLVEKGRQEWRWDQELFAPATFLFASAPTFIAPGNHDESSPLMALMFMPPTGSMDWSRWQQVVGPVHLVGIDSEGDWSADSQNARWLEQVLAGSRSEFLFLITHYPPWSSGPHGLLNEARQPTERPSRQGREVILPMLAKYHATAILCGHDHLYERSEPPGGVTVIITGGGGAPLKQPSQGAATQNPYSKALASKLHYCLFTIESHAACMMQVFTPPGELLDAREWSPRLVPAESLTTQPDRR